MRRTGKRLAFFDLTGTLVHHEHHERPVPLMPHVLRSLCARGWRLVVVTRYSESAALSLLNPVLPGLPLEIVSAEDKGKAIREVLATCPKLETAIFVDDKPKNLLSAKAIAHPKLTVHGFVGSRKYCPELSRTCASHGIPLILGAPDLVETLKSGSLDTPDYDAMTTEELASLIPGLDHPASATAGETNHFDHRGPVTALCQAAPDWWKHAWPELGWIPCEECLWKVLVESVIAAAGLDRYELLGAAYKADEYFDKLSTTPDNTRRKLAPTFSDAMHSIERGIEAIGPGAERCRPDGRDPFDTNRIQNARQKIQALCTSEGGGAK
jgi:hypothetical protein